MSFLSHNVTSNLGFIFTILNYFRNGKFISYNVTISHNFELLILDFISELPFQFFFLKDRLSYMIYCGK